MVWDLNIKWSVANSVAMMAAAVGKRTRYEWYVLWTSLSAIWTQHTTDCLSLSLRGVLSQPTFFCPALTPRVFKFSGHSPSSPPTTVLLSIIRLPTWSTPNLWLARLSCGSVAGATREWEEEVRSGEWDNEIGPLLLFSAGLGSALVVWLWFKSALLSLYA